MRSLVKGALLALVLAGSGAAMAADRDPAALSYGQYQASGLASWYGSELAGNRTASGERFDPEAITAAHRSLPMGSIIEVTAVDSGKSILVRVNDRGPGRKDRLIDLSHGAARLLGTDRHAAARVRVRTMAPGAALAAARPDGVVMASSGIMPGASDDAPPGAGPYMVQIASFSNEGRAAALARTLDARSVARRGLWRVRLGPFADMDKAQRARDAVAGRGYGNARILAED